MRALVTGGAGFIGSHLVDELLRNGWSVTVLDNFDPFYDPEIKKNNIKSHLGNEKYQLVREDLRDLSALRAGLSGEYDVVVHLAAKAGVRPSITNPIVCQEVNVNGTQNLLELTKEWGVQRFIFASSSSVYGVNPNVPWREEDHVLLPISPYASTKVSGELMGYVYSHLYNIRFIALRFFTVFGPRQRPDLAIHKFARLMLAGKTIQIYGDGTTRRDYTYVDDIVSGIRAAMDYCDGMYQVINLGNNQTVTLNEVVRNLEETLEVQARFERLPQQPGDVPQTWADLQKARTLLGYEPKTCFREGLKHFAKWIRDSSGVNK